MLVVRLGVGIYGDVLACAKCGQSLGQRSPHCLTFPGFVLWKVSGVGIPDQWVWWPTKRLREDVARQSSGRNARPHGMSGFKGPGNQHRRDRASSAEQHQAELGSLKPQLSCVRSVHDPMPLTMRVSPRWAPSRR